MTLITIIIIIIIIIIIMIINEMQLYLNDQIFFFWKILTLTGYSSISLVLRKIGVLKYVYS